MACAEILVTRTNPILTIPRPLPRGNWGHKEGAAASAKAGNDSNSTRLSATPSLPQSCLSVRSSLSPTPPSQAMALIGCTLGRYSPNLVP